MKIRQRANQVVACQSETCDILLQGIAADPEPESSARVRGGVPVGLVGPVRATSGIEQSNKRILLKLRKQARNRKKQSEEEKQA